LYCSRLFQKSQNKASESERSVREASQNNT
jgi:hypothetical protein